MQWLVGNINFNQCFCSNFARNIKVYSLLPKLKVEEDFKLNEGHHGNFDETVRYLLNPSFMIPSDYKRPLLSVNDDTCNRFFLA